MTPYEHLEANFRRAALIGEAAAIVGWDTSVMMPEGAAAMRADQSAMLGVLQNAFVHGFKGRFTLGATVCDLGQFSTTLTKFCTHTLAAGTNAPNGYILSYVATPTLTNGAYTISAMATQTASVLGSEQFGFNLKANTAAGSFTSSNFGAEPSGGSGTVMSGYNVADQFKFNVAGDNIAESTTASLLTTFTAAFIANIQFATEAGTYATPITYNIVASY